MKIIIDTIKKNENKINKSIKYRIQGIYHDFWITQVADNELLSDFFFNIGMGYQLLNSKEYRLKALKYFQNAEDANEKLKDYEKLFEVYNEIGILYYEIDKFKFAHIYYNKAYELAIDRKLDDNKKSACLVNLASIDMIEKNYESAVDKLKIALKLFKTDSITKFPEESSIFLANSYFNLGCCYLYLLEFNDALYNFKLGKEFLEYPVNVKKRIESILSFIEKDIESDDDEKIKLILAEIYS